MAATVTITAPTSEHVVDSTGPLAKPRWWSLTHRNTALFAGAGVAILLSAIVTASAMRRTSATFDEITFIGAGARAFKLGRLDLVPEHPPLMQLLYGAPVFASAPNFPREFDTPTNYAYRYEYARQLLWGSGNDAERLIFRARLVAVGFVVLLLVLVFAYTRWAFGAAEAFLATVLVAFLPDVLAHGGVAYNDLPFAVLYLASIIALDSAVRRPTVLRGAAAGIMVGLAFGTKLSAVATLFAAGLFFAVEASRRLRDRAWWKAALATAVVAASATTGTIAVVYVGDFLTFAWSLARVMVHTSVGFSQGAYLFGERSANGWWYFFPAVFPFKTTIAFQALLFIALARVITDARSTRGKTAPTADRARPVVLALIAFVALLLSAELNLGFRYALPAMPLVCILISAGIIKVWRSVGALLRAGLAVLIIANTASVLAAYPYFLAFASGWAPKDRADLVFVDSNLDWGQGLIALREFQTQNRIGPVYLAYHGSALPSGYGVEYVSWPSYHSLAATSVSDSPRYAVISASLLHGLKIPGDVYASFRRRKPDHILAGSLLVYDLMKTDTSSITRGSVANTVRSALHQAADRKRRTGGMVIPVSVNSSTRGANLR
jgi:hypothetical protein